MAKKKYTRNMEVRDEVVKVLSWVVSSGVAGFALASLLDLIPQLSIPMDLKLTLGYAINVIAYAVKELTKKSVG